MTCLRIDLAATHLWNLNWMIVFPLLPFAAEDTMTMCKRALEKLLVTQFNYTEADAREVVNENWIGGRSMKGGENIVSQVVEKVFPIGDVLLLFKVLKKFNIRVRC